MKNISISITDEQAAELKGVQLRTGAPISLQIRRALDLYADVTGKLSHADSVAVSLKTVETWTTKSNDVPLAFAPEHQLRLEQAERQQQKA
jgi:hypothetical protein